MNKDQYITKKRDQLKKLLDLEDNKYNIFIETILSAVYDDGFQDGTDKGGD